MTCAGFDLALFMFFSLLVSIFQLEKGVLSMYIKPSTFAPGVTSHAHTSSPVVTKKAQDEAEGRLTEANGTYYREYVPLQRMPLPEEDGVTYGNFSKLYVVYSPSHDKRGREESGEDKVNLTILPLSTLLVLFVYSCFKVTQWCGEDIREADDKMLQFFLPMYHPEKEVEDKPTRMPRRTNSVRSRTSQGTCRSNSVRSSDSKRMACSEFQHCEVHSDSPLARRILVRHKRCYSPGIAPRIQDASSSSRGRHKSERRRHRTKSKSRDSLRVKSSLKDRRSKTSTKRREHELHLISMPLELHFSHMMLGRNRDLPSLSTPSSASQSPSTGLSVSESVPLINVARLDSRKTSMDSGAVALGSQSSSSQTDVTPDTATTTGFSSDSVSSPMGFRSPTVNFNSVRAACKGRTLPDPLPTSESMWQQYRPISSTKTEEAYSKGLRSNGFAEDSYPVASACPAHQAAPGSGMFMAAECSWNAQGVECSNCKEKFFFQLPAISPEDVCFSGEMDVKSLRSSHSSDTAATVLYSSSRSQYVGKTASANSGLDSKSDDSVAARDATLFSSSSWSAVPDRRLSETAKTDFCTLPLRTISSSSSEKSPNLLFSSRRSQISFQRDFANGIRKSLSADVMDFGDFIDFTTASGQNWRPCSLYLGKEHRELDCLEIRNAEMKWYEMEPTIKQSPSERQGLACHLKTELLRMQ